MALIAILVSVLALVAFLIGMWWPAPVLRVPGNLLAQDRPGRVDLPFLILGVAAVAVGLRALVASLSRPSATDGGRSGF